MINCQNNSLIHIFISPLINQLSTFFYSKNKKITITNFIILQKQKKSEQRKKNNLRGWKKLSLTLLKGHLVFAFAPSVMNQTRLETKSGLLIEQITELALESRSCQAGNFHSIFGWHYAIKRGNFLRLKSLKKIGRCGELKGFKKKKKMDLNGCAKAYLSFL